MPWSGSKYIILSTGLPCLAVYGQAAHNCVCRLVLVWQCMVRQCLCQCVISSVDRASISRPPVMCLNPKWREVGTGSSCGQGDGRRQKYKALL